MKSFAELNSVTEAAPKLILFRNNRKRWMIQTRKEKDRGRGERFQDSLTLHDELVN